jgi:hypothetical protein
MTNTTRCVAVLTVATSLVLGGIATAQSQEKSPPATQQKGPQVPSTGIPKAASPCQAGWHIVGKYDPTNYTCAPNKPAKITCPQGSEYFENKSGTDVCGYGCRPLLK